MNKIIFSIFIVIIFFNSGCGPSSRELALASEKDRLLQEIENLKLKNKFMEDDIVKFKIEQVRLEKKIVDDAYQLNKKNEIIRDSNERNSEKKVAQSALTPDLMTIRGNVFVSTKGKDNVKLGNISIYITKLGGIGYLDYIKKIQNDLNNRIQKNSDEYCSLDKKRNWTAKSMREDIDIFLNCNNLIIPLVKKLDDLPVGYKFDKTTFDKDVNSIRSKILSLNNTKSQASFRLIESKDGYVKIVDKMKNLYNNSVAERRSVFFSHAVNIAKTDADGNFEINNIVDGEDFVLIAEGKRLVSSGDYESYFWVSHLSQNQYEKNNKIILSNNNLISLDNFFKFDNKNINYMFKLGIPDVEKLEGLDEIVNNDKKIFNKRK
jgi:hypothetical protein